MAVDIIILVIDLLVIIGFSAKEARKIKRQIKTISEISVLVPVIVLFLRLLPLAVTGSDSFLDEFVIQFQTVIIVVVTGHVFSALTAVVTEPISRLLKKLF